MRDTVYCKSRPYSPFFLPPTKQKVPLLSIHPIIMLKIHRHRALLFCLKGITFPPTSPSPKPFPFSLRFCTNTSESDSPSFAVSYLIHNFGFSPQSASKLCSTYHVRFKTAESPDSVLNFFRNRGFSNPQLHNMIERAPWLLSCDPYKRLLPKFEFFLSKGASTSDIVNLVSKHPIVLSPSLENQIVPAYDLVYRFLQSDKDTISLLKYNPFLFGNGRVAHSIRVLIENGVTDSNIARLLKNWSKIFDTRDMGKVVEELKNLGFHPSKSTFSVALVAKLTVSRTKWDEKVDAFKKWGWSDKDIMEAFRRQPHSMLASIDKINLVMSFWVNQLGWDALALAKGPWIIGFSLERRIIPRASVVQFLLKKGLRKKNASLTSPFSMTEKLFVDKFIKRFMEDSSYLLKLYEEKLNLAYIRENTGMS